MTGVGSPDYPKVRALTWCCVCGHDKRPGLLVCWPCNNGLKALFNGGYGPNTEAQFAKIERGEYTERESDIAHKAKLNGV